jgi:hypothetical protein
MRNWWWFIRRCWEGVNRENGERRTENGEAGMEMKRSGIPRSGKGKGKKGKKEKGKRKQRISGKAINFEKYYTDSFSNVKILSFSIQTSISLNRFEKEVKRAKSEERRAESGERREEGKEYRA